MFVNWPNYVFVWQRSKGEKKKISTTRPLETILDYPKFSQQYNIIIYINNHIFLCIYSTQFKRSSYKFVYNPNSEKKNVVLLSRMCHMSLGLVASYIGGMSCTSKRGVRNFVLGNRESNQATSYVFFCKRAVKIIL